MSEKMYDKLLRKINYGKSSCLPQRYLYEAKGAIDIAFELGAITKEEFFELDHQCVYDGINNPKYFDRD